jgi:hypothetical protein
MAEAQVSTTHRNLTFPMVSTIDPWTPQLTVPQILHDLSLN